MPISPPKLPFLTCSTSVFVKYTTVICKVVTRRGVGLVCVHALPPQFFLSHSHLPPPSLSYLPLFYSTFSLIKNLAFHSSDTVKKRSTLSTLAGLWHRAGDSTQLVATYSTLIGTYPPEETGGEEVTRVWTHLTTVLLAEKTLPEQSWKMVQ